MPSKLRDVLVALAGAAAAAAAFYAATPTAGQAGSRIPRTTAGKPNLNGIWQALNTANYDLEAHVARPALAMRPGPVIPVPAREVLAFGAVGSVPGGVGVVVGGAIPYTPEAQAKKKENQDELADARSRDQVLPAGRAARDLHAVSVSDLPERHGVLHRLRVCGRDPQRVPEGSGSAADRFVDGAVGRTLGGRDVCRRHQRIPRSELVRSRGQPPQRSADRDRALHDDRARSPAV